MKTLEELRAIKAELSGHCPKFNDFTYQEVLDWASKVADASLKWENTFVNGHGERFVIEDRARWSFAWRFGFITFEAFKKDEEERAKKAAAMMIWLWIKHNVPIEYAERCAESYAKNYTFYKE